jgi:TM2 domain-containing membrane protein YozV
MAVHLEKQSCPACGGQTANPGQLCANCDAKQRDIFNNPYTNTTGNPPPPPPPDQSRWITTLLLCLLLGNLGIHRFYTGHTGIGIAQLFTLGGCGIWSLIDLIQIISGSFRDAQGNPIKNS